MNDGHHQSRDSDQGPDEAQSHASRETDHIEIRSSVKDVQDGAFLHRQAAVIAILPGEGQVARLLCLRSRGMTESAIPAVVQDLIVVCYHFRHHGSHETNTAISTAF